MPEDESLGSLKSLFYPLTLGKAVHFLLFIGLIVYGNSLFNGFVGDDHGQILTNPIIHSLKNIPYIFQGSTLFLEQVGSSAGLYYRPILSMTFAFIYSVSGPNAFPYHLFQLSLHIINSILILLLLKKHFKLQVAFILSLLFLIHPINNEAVVYISNMQEELFAFYGLLAINMVSFRREVFVVPVLLFLSLLSKETGIIFFPLILLYYFFFTKRTASRTKYLLFSVIGTFAVYVLLRIAVGNIGLNTHFLYMSANATLLERLYTIPSLLLYYLRGVFFPVSPAFGWYWVVKHPDWINFGIPLIVSLGSLLSIYMSFISLKKDTTHKKIFIFFLMIFVLSIGLIVQIFPLDITVADRWFYMPFLGILGMLGVLYEAHHRNLFRSKKMKQFGLVLLVATLVFFAGRDIARNTNWADNYTLCNHDTQVNTKSYILEFCLSNELYNRKEYKPAELHARKAIDLYPEYFLSWYTLGKIQYALDDKDNAKNSFKKTLQYNEFSLGSEELALLYVYEKNTGESRRVLDEYLEKLPNSAQLWYAKALTEYIDGKSDEATASAKKAYELNPSPLTEKVYVRLQNNLPISF